jgi:tricorn protease
MLPGMTRARLLLLCLLWVAGTAQVPSTAQITPPHMVQTPDIHGEQIVFSSEGDLWLGNIASGTTVRLTTHEGVETNPRFSPDGNWIAFTGEYDGGQDVYVMPTGGGAPRRVTYDLVGAQMVAWTPDGAQILFRSGRLNPIAGPRLFLVSAQGGVPQPLPMERAAQASFAPDGRHLAYCRLPMENAHWKRYRGGQANRIWIADLDAKTFHRIDDDTINEQYPAWAGRQIIYVSERDGTANLWRYDVKTRRAAKLTLHDSYDVRSPATDGKQVIYQYGEGLWVYDLQTNRDRQLKLTLSSDLMHARPHTVAGTIGEWGIGPTGKRLVVEGRGQLFTLPVEKGELRAVAPSPGSRAQHPAWSPDGKMIAYVSDRNGEANLWLAPAGGVGEPQPLTKLTGLRLDSPAWSPDSKLIAYRDNSNALMLLDVAQKTVTEVARGDYGRVGQFAFSPDSRWIAYDRPENFFVTSLYLYNIAAKTATRLTTPPTRDYTPVFDPAGKYLYFTSERSVTPHGDAFDFQNDFEKTTKIYLITLAQATPLPLPVESDEEPGSVPADEQAPPTGAETAKLATTMAKTAVAPMKVDTDGIGERLMELPMVAGDYRALTALPGKLLYLSADAATPAGARLKQYDFATKKETELATGVQGYQVSADGKKLAVRTAEGVQVGDVGGPIGPEAKRVDISGWRIPVDPPAEWRQIFAEAWRNHRDLFYDARTHGQDWQAVRHKYEALLPLIGSRNDLNTIIGEMQGEMNVSHEFVSGGYMRRRAEPGPGYGALGADLVYDVASKVYRLGRIFPGDGFDMTARSPLLLPGVNVHTGDVVLAINGLPLRADQDPNALLVGQGGKVVTLLVNTRPTPDGARTVRIKAMNGEGQARYYDWAARNRDYVARNGGANMAYIHLPDMSNNGIVEFTKRFYADLDKDGIILDVRYNGGGIISGQILERLHRVIFEYDQGRYGRPEPYHRTAYLGRIVVICNERTASDGEYFCTGIRYMKLGPTVGTRTWGGFMAVNSFPTIDGGFVSTPAMGSFTPEGKWLPDGYGFNPDFVVEEDPNAFVAGRDPQLDKAISLLKEEIKQNPPHWPKRLDPPSKEKAFGPNKG